MNEQNTQVKNALIHDCMKAEFEDKVINMLDFSKGMEAFDKWFDPLIRQFFTEHSQLSAYLLDPYYTDPDIITEEDLIGQKKGCLTTLLARKLQNETRAILRTTASLDAVDDTLNKLIDDYFINCNLVREYYKCGCECDSECCCDE